MPCPRHPDTSDMYYRSTYGRPLGGCTFPRQTQDPLYGYSEAVAGQDGQIDAEELQRCLTQLVIAG